MKNQILRWAVALLTALAFSTATLAQSDAIQVDISAEDLLTGEADEKLQQAGAQAAIEERPVTLTAPSYWREMVEEQLNVGAGDTTLSITYRETFIESVIVRLGGVSEAPAAEAEVAAVEPAPQASAPPPEVDIQPERPEVVAFERPSLESIESDAADAVEAVNGNDLQPALEIAIDESAVPDLPVSNGNAVEAEEVVDDVVAEAPVSEPVIEEPAVEVVETAPVPEPAPAEVASAADPTPAEDAPATDPTPGVTDAAIGTAAIAAARESLESRLNRGREIDKELRPDQLRPGDQLFRTDGVVAVVRRSSLRNNAYWLEGDLDLEREEIRLIQPGKYELTRLLDLDDDGVASVDDDEPEVEAPAQVETVALNDNLEERTRMEALYNGGRPIEQAVSSNRLVKDDMLYVGDGLIVVVRRTRVRLERFWLEGEIDLGRDELIQQGNRKFRVKRDIR